MELRLASWNILDALSRHPDAWRYLLDLHADIAVFPEAYAEAEADSPATKKNISELEEHGYTVVQIPYDDEDDRHDRHGLIVMSRRRLANTSISSVRLVDRNAALVEIPMLNLTIVGVHLNDREETSRLEQARRAIDIAATSPNAVIMGDINSTDSGFAKQLLRSPPVEAFIRKLPVGEPGTAQSKQERIGSLLSRLHGMTSGRTFDEIERASYTDADLKRRPTMPANFPFVQLDHVFYRGKQTGVSRFKRHDPRPISDHRAISVTLSSI